MSQSPAVCYAAGMTGYLNAKGIRIFDYADFAKTLRDRVRESAALLAAEAGVTIEHIAKPHIRKEDVVARVLAQRGDRPGLVHVISAMEACDAYKPWHDKQTHKTFIWPDNGKCLHYYFYLQDVKFGLVYLRLPTWAPLTLAPAMDRPGADAGELRAVLRSDRRGIGQTDRVCLLGHVAALPDGDPRALQPSHPHPCSLPYCRQDEHRAGPGTCRRGASAGP